jgi:hypothetical protein
MAPLDQSIMELRTYQLITWVQVVFKSLSKAFRVWLEANHLVEQLIYRSGRGAKRVGARVNICISYFISFRGGLWKAKTAVIANYNGTFRTGVFFDLYLFRY